jgi:predicted nuclease with TOPRIM domain
MDDQLDQRLRAILESAEAAAVNAGADVDILPIRNEIEDMEGRLAEFIRETHEVLVDRLESNREAIRNLQERLDEIAGTVEAIQSELPPE